MKELRHWWKQGHLPQYLFLRICTSDFKLNILLKKEKLIVDVNITYSGSFGASSGSVEIIYMSFLGSFVGSSKTSPYNFTIHKNVKIDSLFLRQLNWAASCEWQLFKCFHILFSELTSHLTTFLFLVLCFWICVCFVIVSKF